MNKLYENVKEKLSLIENMYDIIRIIDPINKNIIDIKNDEIKNIKGKCYENFNKGTICSNCISIRANIENDIFIKIEHVYNKVMLIIAMPAMIKEEKYVVEIIKDISVKNNKISSINYDKNVKVMIDNMNEKIIKDDLMGVYNRIYIEERLPVDLNNSILNKYLLSIIMIDIDDFKNVNEEHRQDIVKKILKDFYKLIDDLVAQNSYWIGRYSNDKFIIVLNNIDKEDVCKISEQIRILLEDVSLEYNDKIIKLKASFGIYCSENEITDIKNILTELEKNIFEEKKKRIDEEKNKEKKLSILNYRIQELRDVLNEMCISLDKTVNYEQTLKVSQDLDELIVEYMKNII
ncbi:MAG: diguanylate cyclase [Clostridium sp.]|uniref:diguanylate cyclase n=1 Tax=Clostridium sp. TaxID=1506 RepID=UPI0025C5465F|nr:diguanylate cyclase [Clostridium sp.]MCE5222299.1 diguanylate cyclase [Clostridium sp.]